MKENRRKWIAGALAATAALVFWGLYALHAPLNIQANTTLKVESGRSLSAVLNELEERDVLHRRTLVDFYVRVRGMASNIKAGEYALAPGLTAPQLLRRMVRGKVIRYRATLVEGWTTAQALEYLWQLPKLSRVLEDDNPDALAVALNIQYPTLEGLFHPDTYWFTASDSELDILTRARAAQQRLLDKYWKSRAADLPYKNPYQVLIMASIIEKETGTAAERERIAGVFVRRLQRRMRLQTDPTVIYALGADFDGNIRRRDLRNPSPYNTYRHHGLPPTPIALPGEAAIRAALNPAAGDSLYFVARGDGGHVFSATLKEHQAAVRTYQLRRRKRSR